MDVNYLLADEEYRDLLGQYTKSYIKLLEVLPKKKRQLAVNFIKVAEQVIKRRVEIFIEKNIENKG